MWLYVENGVGEVRGVSNFVEDSTIKCNNAKNRCNDLCDPDYHEFYV